MSTLLDSDQHMIRQFSWYWEWQDDGQTIAWYDGQTLSFANEILAIIEQLGADKTPPLGAILLYLAAMRNNWAEAPQRSDILRRLITIIGQANDLTLLERVIPLLDKLHSLPEELRKQTQVKVEIAAELFAGLFDRDRTPQHQKAIDAALITRNLTQVIKVPQASQGMRELRHDLSCLQIGLSGFDATRFQQMLKTGIAGNLQPLTLKAPPVDTPRQFLQKLLTDQELGGLARLTQRMIALVNLPRALDDREELPLGGVTDISPRGSFDRLLLSELANDQELLAVRLALNEALYLRRESPPRRIPQQRQVLVDVGLRMWGMPRLFAAAVGLALAVHHDAHVQVQLHYYAQKTLQQVNLIKREDWVNLLGALDEAVQPGRALLALLKQNENDETDQEQLAPVLVTCAEAWQDPVFQQLLLKQGASDLYIALVSRAGQYQLWQRTKSGLKQISRAQLRLEDLLDQPSAQQNLVAPEVTADLPAILQQSLLPLRQVGKLEYERTWPLDDKRFLSVTHDRRLLLWDERRLGGLELLRGLTGDNIVACKMLHKYEMLIIAGNWGPNSLQAIHIKTDGTLLSQVTLDCPFMTPREVVLHQGVIYLFTDNQVAAIDPNSGHVLAKSDLPALTKRTGRYYALHELPCSHWYFIFFDGQQILHTALTLDDKISYRYWAVFDRQEPNQPHYPLGMRQLSNDAVQLVDVDTLQPLIQPVIDITELQPAEARLSRDGREILIPHTDGRIHHFALQGETIQKPMWGYMEPVIRNQTRDSVWIHFGDLVINQTTDSCRIGLMKQNRSVNWFKNNLASEDTQATLQPTDRVLKWSRVKHPAVNGFELYEVEFCDGSKIWKDSRGMLHFRSSDTDIPEFSIVVSIGSSAGWVADGRYWGMSYYMIGHQDNNRTQEIVAQVINPFLARLQCN
jgi:hypothetical protein